VRTNTDNQKGQVLPDSRLGNWLTALASSASVIVEIGTWKGFGSTLCLANGLSHPKQKFYTVESDEACWREARSHYTDPRIHFVKGHCLDVLDNLPSKIDLLLLDGADDTTDAEFDALANRATIIVLDDTKTRKNARQRDFILKNSSRFSLVADYPDDRNGWLCARRLSMKTMICCSYWNGNLDPMAELKKKRIQLWEENVMRFAPQCERLVLAVDNADPGLKHTQVIKLPGNLGNYMQVVERQVPYLHQGCTMQFVALAQLAYVNECDFIYQEQDCLAFGDYVQALYDAVSSNGMCVGRMHATEWAAVALMLVRHRFIPEFVRWWSASDPELDRNQLSELKMRRMMDGNVNEIVWHDLGPERRRPFDPKKLPFYIQQVTWEDIDILKKENLI
jgi:hypothetical protein